MLDRRITNPRKLIGISRNPALTTSGKTSTATAFDQSAGRRYVFEIHAMMLVAVLVWQRNRAEFRHRRTMEEFPDSRILDFGPMPISGRGTGDR
jgi:hypothetical protein